MLSTLLNLFQGCQPYSIAACEHHVDGDRPPCGEGSTPKCKRTCAANYDVEYTEDLYFGKSITQIERVLATIVE